MYLSTYVLTPNVKGMGTSNYNKVVIYNYIAKASNNHHNNCTLHVHQNRTIIFNPVIIITFQLRTASTLHDCKGRVMYGDYAVHLPQNVCSSTLQRFREVHNLPL